MKCFAGKWKYLPQKINSEIHEARMESMTVIFTCTDKVTFFPADSDTIAACYKVVINFTQFASYEFQILSILISTYIPEEEKK